MIFLQGNSLDCPELVCADPGCCCGWAGPGTLQQLWGAAGGLTPSVSAASAASGPPSCMLVANLDLQNLGEPEDEIFGDMCVV